MKFIDYIESRLLDNPSRAKFSRLKMGVNPPPGLKLEVDKKRLTHEFYVLCQTEEIPEGASIIFVDGELDKINVIAVPKSGGAISRVNRNRTCQV